MKLIRRKQTKTPVQKGLDIVRLGLRGIVAFRVFRSARTGVRVVKRLPMIAALAAAGALVARKLRGGGQSGQTDFSTPAASGPVPTSGPSPAETSGRAAPTEAAAAASSSPATDAPELGGTNGPPSADIAPELADSPVETAATGTPPVEESKPKSKGRGTAKAKAGDTPSNGELDVEGPNESAPGHHPDEADKPA